MKKLKKKRKKRGLETTHTLIGVCDFKLSLADILNTEI